MIESDSTPSFRQSFINTSQGLATMIEKDEASSTATVASSSVSSNTPGEVTVYLVIDQQTTNVSPTNPRVFLNHAIVDKVLLTLDYSDGKWLIANLQTVK